ncbi:MAG: heavy metal translocating P-type ATPase [Ruminococcus sp.]|nr:heavy metal translocating P-type ATPase [Ruminococcus sp.]
MKYTFTLENLNCANCAGKIEKKIALTRGYQNVSFNFATKKLNFTSDKPDVLGEIQAICDSIEDGVRVTDDNAKEADHSHEGGRLQKILLIVAIVCAAAAFVLHLSLNTYPAQLISSVLSAAAALLAGYPTFWRGIKSVLKLRIDESTLMTAAVIAAFALGEFVEGAMVAVLFAVGELIEEKAVDASRRDIEKLSKIRPDVATILHNGHEETAAAETVAVGSVIVVKPHERIPLDGVVTDSHSTVNNAALTGESVPVDVSEGSEVMSGAINGEQPLKITTTKEFGDSTATRILRMVEEAAAQKGRKEKLISRFAAIYTPVVIAIAVLVAVIPPLSGMGSWGEWIYRAAAVLVASCPCAIVISVPLAYYAGIGSASRSGVLIKGGKYLEALAEADAFAFDKTGTLTTGELSVDRVYARGGYTKAQILSLTAACERYSSHPVAKAIRRAANSSDAELTDLREIPGKGVQACYRGKPIYCGGERFLEQPVPTDMPNANVFLIYDGSIIGAVAVSDTVRAESKAVLEKLRALGVKRTVMLTGDSKSNAAPVAKQLALSEFRAELMPADKLNVISELKQKSRAVCFVGDGINDAPVLSAADCGAAMGLGSEAAIEASDVVLSSGTLENLPSAVILARKAIRTVKSNIAFAIAVKVAVIVLAALGITPMWLSVFADTGVCVICVLYTARLLNFSSHT